MSYMWIVKMLCKHNKRIKKNPQDGPKVLSSSSLAIIWRQFLGNKLTIYIYIYIFKNKIQQLIDLVKPSYKAGECRKICCNRKFGEFKQRFILTFLKFCWNSGNTFSNVVRFLNPIRDVGECFHCNFYKCGK